MKLDVGATLSRVFELYGKQAGILLPAALIVFIPVVVVIAIITAIVLSTVTPTLSMTTAEFENVDVAAMNAQLSASVLPLTILAFVSIALSLVGTYWYQGIVVNAVSDMEDGKRDHTIGSLFSASAPFIVPLIGAGLLVGLAIIGIGLVIALITSFIPPLAIIAMPVGVVVILWLVIRWSVISPAIVVEKTGVGGAFGRSSQLVEGNWWRVLGVVVVVGILTAIVSFILSAILGGIGGPTIGPSLAQLVTNTLMAPLAGLAAAILFFQLRAVKEGGAAPAGDAPPPAAPPPPPAVPPPPPAAPSA